MKKSISKEIKSTKNLSLKTYFFSSYLISNRISPYVSQFYIKRKIRPNVITLHMIFSGIAGAIFFSFPYLIAKIIGAFLVQLWFILDCSDGEVARYTKTFSQRGKELDFMAHLVGHPLMIISFGFSIVQLGLYDKSLIWGVVLISILLDSTIRNLILVNFLVNKTGSVEVLGERDLGHWTPKKIRSFIIDIFLVYPNLILFGVLIYFIDLYCQTSFLLLYITVNGLITLLFVIKTMVVNIIKFYK